MQLSHRNLPLMPRRTPTPIIDRNGRIIAMLIGRGGTADWPSVFAYAEDALRRARARLLGRSSPHCHSRGSYAAVTTGTTFG